MRKPSQETQENENHTPNYLKDFRGFEERNIVHDDNDNFDREDDDGNEDLQEAFSFKDYEDEFKDDEMKLPDDLFSKFSHERKHSSGSDDMVKTGV